jgi:hypothetical protein
VVNLNHTLKIAKTVGFESSHALLVLHSPFSHLRMMIHKEEKKIV